MLVASISRKRWQIFCLEHETDRGGIVNSWYIYTHLSRRRRRRRRDGWLPIITGGICTVGTMTVHGTRCSFRGGTEGTGEEEVKKDRQARRGSMGKLAPLDSRCGGICHASVKFVAGAPAAGSPARRSSLDGENSFIFDGSKTAAGKTGSKQAWWRTLPLQILIGHHFLPTYPSISLPPPCVRTAVPFPLTSIQSKKCVGISHALEEWYTRTDRVS